MEWAQERSNASPGTRDPELSQAKAGGVESAGKASGMQGGQDKKETDGEAPDRFIIMGDSTTKN